MVDRWQGHFVDTPKGNAKNAEVLFKDVSMDSDTDVMVLSFVPSTRAAVAVRRRRRYRRSLLRFPALTPAQ